MARSWDSLGGKILDRWFTDAFTPAFVFWSGGAALAVVTNRSWSAIEEWVDAQSQVWLVALGILGLLGIHASAVAVEGLASQAIRWLEGYWPKGLRRVERALVSRIEGRYAPEQDRLEKLDQLEERKADQDREHARIDEELRSIPAELSDLMPTRLGNILRAAEARPLAKYGLDVVTCWPRLWLLLPDLVRKELSEAHSRLEGAAQVWLFGILFLLWAPLSLLAVPIASVVAVFAYWRLLAEARVFGDLLESAFDLHRTALYSSLGWQLPVHPADERTRGRELTQYLRRGSALRTPEFTWAEREPNEGTAAVPIGGGAGPARS